MATGRGRIRLAVQGGRVQFDSPAARNLRNRLRSEPAAAGVTGNAA